MATVGSVCWLSYPLEVFPMRNKSRSEFLITVLCLLAAAMPVKATEATDEFLYNRIEESDGPKIYIRRYIGSSAAVTVPDTIDGAPVVGIWFLGIGAPLTLTSITIPDGVIELGEGVFLQTPSLTNIIIGAGVVYLPSLEHCTRLSNITIGKGITDIGYRTFFGCTGLTRITIPDNITNIGDDAFAGCTSLTNILIPGSVTHIGSGAFQDCTSLSSVVMLNGVISIGDSAFAGCTNLSTLYMPDSVSSIAEVYGSFYGCPLTDITLPSGITNIANGTLGGCNALVNLTLGSGVTSIDINAFQDQVHTNLTSLAVNSSNTTYYSVDGVLFSKDPNALIKYPMHKAGGEYTVPDGVTAIGSGAFTFCESLTNITFPSSVTNIGDGPSCPNLKRLYFNGNAPDADWVSGSGPTGLCIYYLHGTTGWESGFFQVPTRSSVPFTYTTNNGTITITGDAGNMPENYFAIIPDTIDGLPVTSIGDYASWEDSRSIILWMIGVTIPNSVTNIGISAFAGCSFTNITIPDSVTAIGAGAFCDNRSLTSVTIGNGVTDIGEDAFSVALSLTNVTFGTNVANIGQEAFFFCTNLTSVILPNSVTNIGPNAFAISGLTSITIPDSCISIEGMAFYLCFGLTNVVMGNSVTRIGNMAFERCSFSNITIPNSVTNIDAFAFIYCTNLVSITIPSNVISIGNWSFWGCTNLTSVTILNSDTSIGGGAFSDCTNMTAVYFTGNAPIGYDWAFIETYNVTIYHLESATGWPPVPDEWNGRPTALWQYETDSDADGNGLPDWWERKYFGSPTNANPNTICSNGVNTVREAYIIGINPADASERFGIIYQLGPHATLHWNTVSGRVYSVYWTTNLLSGFQCLESNIPWTRGSFTNQSTEPNVYYKIDVRLP